MLYFPASFQEIAFKDQVLWQQWPAGAAVVITAALPARLAEQRLQLLAQISIFRADCQSLVGDRKSAGDVFIGPVFIRSVGADNFGEQLDRAGAIHMGTRR